MSIQKSENSDMPPAVSFVDAVRLSEVFLAMFDSRFEALERALTKAAKLPPADGPRELEPLLTTRDVARLLGCEQRSVHRWLRDGVIPEPIRIGGVLRWYAPTIRGWILSKQGILNVEGGPSNEGA